MQLLACGINYKTAPISIREKVIFNFENLAQSLGHLVEQTPIKEAAILSTCHRTELYCASENSEPVIQWLHDYQQLPQQSLQPYLYVHQGQAAVQHIIRVATGLDSMILGEPQILGQLKKAFLQADLAGTIGKQLQHLFQYIFSASKKIRTSTAIGDHPLTVASAAFDLAKQIFADLNQINLLCVGAGETIELVTQHVQKLGIKKLWIANRTLSNADRLAKNCLATSITFDKIHEVLPEVDMVVTATSSQLPIIGKGALESAIRKRKRRLMFLVDLAVPRNIEPEVSALKDVYCYTLDDLNGVIQKNLAERQAAAHHAEQIVTQQVDQYMRSLNLTKLNPIIHGYREEAEQFRDQEIEEALNLLKKANVSPEEIIKRLANRLTNKILHQPTQDLRTLFLE